MKKTAIYLFCTKCKNRWALLDELAINRLYAEAHEFLRSHSMKGNCTITDIKLKTMLIADK